MDLSRLKARERDSLEAVFKLWQKQSLSAEKDEEEDGLGNSGRNCGAEERENCQGSVVDEFWDGRSRALLGERYDAKEGFLLSDMLP